MFARNTICRVLVISGLALAPLFATGAASAATITWTDWTTIGTGTATGNLGGTTVTWSGPNTGGTTNGTFNWGPSTTYVGGVVGNAPCTGTTTCLGDIVLLTGANNPPATITLNFSAPVVNPVFGVWSLGQPSQSASLTFAAGSAPAIQKTGTNNQFGFVSLTANNNVVSGQEGNGTFLLPGTFSTVSFNASFESFYGLSVGAAGPLTAAIPEPGTYALFAAGLLSVFGFRRRKLTK